MIPRSLRSRVTVIGTITLALVLSVGGWLTVRALAAALRSDLQTQNLEILDRLADQIEGGADPRLIEVPIGADGTEFLVLDAEGGPINVSFVSFTGPLPPDLVAANGAVVVQGAAVPMEAELAESFGATLTPETEAELLELLEELAEAEPARPGGIAIERVAPGSTATSDWYETSRSITTPDGDELTLVALSPFAVVSRSIDRLAVALVILVPLIVLMGAAALWFAVGSALQPVSQLSARARRIAPSTSGDRLEVPDSGDEIAHLTVTLNEMLDRLDAGLRRQRQFVSDASHELRSPLTAVKGAGQMVASDDRLPGDLRPSVDALNRGVGRLESVLDDLTNLADAGAASPRAEVDLADLVLAEIEAAGPEAHDRPEVSIDATGVSPAVVTAYPVRLGRAVRNLIDNAVRHARSRVVVAARIDGDDVVITVDDDGRGVPPADRERVFERFVRLDDARDRAGGGSGLGLAIVAAIADDHDGSVECQTSPRGGARFVLRFPASV